MAQLEMGAMIACITLRRAFAMVLSVAAFYLQSVAVHSQPPDHVPLKQSSARQKSCGSAQMSCVRTRPPNCTGSPTSRTDDWAELARYREANASVHRADVVFMGDSITDFWVQPRFGRFFVGKNYLDRGISGQTTPQMLLRFCQDVIALKPKAVLILAGTNDIAGNTGPTTNEEIEGNLSSMSELAKAAGIKVILASITPVGASQSVQRPMNRIRAINQWMRSYAAANGHVYLDYFSGMLDSSGLLESDLSNDGLHPNAKGYALMSLLAEVAISKAIG
jgi:lysophospholipase L1-like esterase